MEIVTKEDLQIFRLRLLDDIRKLLAIKDSQQAIQWIKSNEVRKILKLSPASLQNLRIGGKLHPVKIGGTWYYNVSEINSLFERK